LVENWDEKQGEKESYLLPEMKGVFLNEQQFLLNPLSLH
jgi:hypothetical protein